MDMRRLLTVATLALSLAASGQAAEPASQPAARDGERRVVVTLVNGDKIEGALLRRDDQQLHLFVGGAVLTVDQAKVKTIQDEAGAGEAKSVKTCGLYKTAKLPVKGVAALAEELGPAIVVVKTPSGLGTGWFCNRDGYLVTCNHVVAGERSITVTMYQNAKAGDSGKKVFKKVRLVALNDNLDLALLKIEEKIDVDYPQLYLGDSTEVVEGQRCVAIGNPMGLERSTSEGIISKAARNDGGRLYLQTTAPIAPGNSGGPLFNERGEVIGMVNMGFIFLDGLGFAIPSKYIREFLDNVEAFAYDQDNPNSGLQFMETPVTSTDNKIKFLDSDFIKLTGGAACLTAADMNGDGVAEIVFANNAKSDIGIARLRKKGEVDEVSGDFEDINLLRGSRLFKIDTIPVASAITSLAVGDINGDKRPDIVFLGDIDGLAVIEQNESGGFKPVRKIDKPEASERRNALRLADLDKDGQLDIVVLGPHALTVFRKCQTREDYPLNGAYKTRIKDFELEDVNGDGRLDVVFFVVDKNYATYVRIQNEAGQFADETPIASSVSGPTCRYRSGKDVRFLTLDKGLNRMRDLKVLADPPAADKQARSLLALAVDAEAPAGSDLELADVTGDGALDLVTVDQKKNAFVVYSYKKSGFAAVRSPSPRSVIACKPLTAGKQAGLFSLSKEDNLFGVSKVEGGKVSYPRPINTDGTVEMMKLQTVFDKTPSLLWVQKNDATYTIRLASAEKIVAAAFDGKKGSIDVESKQLTFGPDAKSQEAVLKQRPADLAFGDLNGDGHVDLLVYWSYTGKESLYLGLGEGQEGGFKEVIKDQKFLEEQKDQPLLVEDVNGDGQKDLLLVKPGFVRMLKVDAKNKLYVEQQFNWPFGQIRQFAFLERSKDNKPRFIALSEQQALIVELDVDKGEFVSVGRIDLPGLNLDSIRVGDVDGDGAADFLGTATGAVNIVLSKPARFGLDSKIVMNVDLDNYAYWNQFPADLDGDGQPEVMLFDSAKGMVEVWRPGKDGQFRSVLRHRLYERTIFQRGESRAVEIPDEVAVADVDGNGKPDFICVLTDRIAVYLQTGKEK